MAAVVLIVFVPIVLLIACGVRFGGDSRLLNVVDYSQISDIASFNRWAGNRLLLLPTVAIPLAVLSLKTPSLAIPMLIVFVLTFLAVIYWVALGASKFQRNPTTRRSNSV
jgi:hypothetical protein